MSLGSHEQRTLQLVRNDFSMILIDPTVATGRTAFHRAKIGVLELVAIADMCGIMSVRTTRAHWDALVAGIVGVGALVVVAHVMTRVSTSVSSGRPGGRIMLVMNRVSAHGMFEFIHESPVTASQKSARSGWVLTDFPGIERKLGHA